MDSLDIAVNVFNIVRYLYKSGVCLLHVAPEIEKSIIYLYNDKYKELFPDAEPDDHGWFPIQNYNGYRVMAVLPETKGGEE